MSVAVLAQQGTSAQPAGDRPLVESSPKPARNDADQVAPAPDLGRDMAIHQMLDLSISAKFDGSPLEDLLKYLKAASTGTNDNGLPIYVEPTGLADMGQTATSPVTVDVEGVKIRSVLERALRPLGLSFTVKDGLLVIDSRTAIALSHLENRLNSFETKLDRILKAVERGEKSPRR
ncbi:hypothetical protein V5E97_39205 [Singulisphaera sp. Ch08]|uniref:Uncharacterized protein n=1 Tax=Singulisphaera sp. Ch08 TaxID=3120278 RepID=A0AAU7CGT1_9BACT